MSSELSSWILPDPGTLELWPTVEIRDDQVGFSAAVPDTWRALDLDTRDRLKIVRVVGSVPGEGLVVVRMAGASADADITAWLELPMAIVGGLDPETLVAPGDTEVLSWAADTDAGLAAHLDVAEARSYTGLARYNSATADRPELLRSYVLLARRGDTAWKLALSLATACALGSDDATIDANDHVRARACLSRLTLG